MPNFLGTLKVWKTSPMGLPEEDRVEKWKTRVAGFVFFLEGDVQQNREEDEIYASQQAPKNFWFRALKFTIPFRAIFFDSPKMGETQEEYRIILLKAKRFLLCATFYIACWLSKLFVVVTYYL